MPLSQITLRLASPRGFCAGVERAIEIVKQALIKNGPPIYVRHEIVHNKHVVDELSSMGAIFVDELDKIPDDAIVVFSAHGVPKAVPAEASRRKLIYADATCPLVSKVHREVEHHAQDGRTILLIGHKGHPEVIGTMGQVEPGSILLIETEEDARTVTVDDPSKLAFATQTTLSVDDAAKIAAILRARFPGILGPRGEDICYATTNRQRAVETLARSADYFLIVGAKNSSNSRRLVEVALRAGCPKATLIGDASDIVWTEIAGARCVGLSAGASAPESLVQEVVRAFEARFDTRMEEVEIVDEDVYFKTPPIPTRRRDAPTQVPQSHA